MNVTPQNENYIQCDLVRRRLDNAPVENRMEYSIALKGVRKEHANEVWRLFQADVDDHQNYLLKDGQVHEKDGALIIDLWPGSTERDAVFIAHRLEDLVNQSPERNHSLQLPPEKKLRKSA